MPCTTGVQNKQMGSTEGWAELGSLGKTSELCSARWGRAGASAAHLDLLLVLLHLPAGSYTEGVQLPTGMGSRQDPQPRASAAHMYTALLNHHHAWRSRAWGRPEKGVSKQHWLEVRVNRPRQATQSTPSSRKPGAPLSSFHRSHFCLSNTWGCWSWDLVQGPLGGRARMSPSMGLGL